MDSVDLHDQIKYFRFPQDDSKLLWRYMGMNRFIEMLLTETVYFRRLDCLEDHFEAVLSPIGVDRWIEEFAPEAIRRNLLPEGVDPFEAGYHTVGSSTYLMRASVFVNCWHQNDYESWAMWKLFGSRLENRSGIAVQSTVGRLRDGMKVKVPVCEVKYVDHDQDESDWRLSWMYKNYMFSWEQEVRAYTFKHPREWSILGFNEDHPTGLYVAVDLDMLIERVVLAPGSNEQSREKTKELLDIYGLGHKPILFSAADVTPEYVKYSQINRQALIDNGLVVPIHSEDSPDR